jgi:CRISPR-associated endonuclease Cas1
VVIGHTGFVTLEALRWLADVRIGFIHLGTDGRVLVTSAGLGLDDPRLRRAQSIAWNTPIGVGIARELLRQKLVGQASVARGVPGGDRAQSEIRQLEPELDHADSAPALMVVEAAAANAYWNAWSSVAIPWVRDQSPLVPNHWRTVGGRASPLTGNPRLAANPAQAILNYLYALAEAEARMACLGTGLDPGLGVLHADQRSRDSLALDVMEAVRPTVDAYVLDLLRTSIFRLEDFHETRQGVCRILPPLSHRLAEMTVEWAKALAPVVERVAQAFADGPESRVTALPSHLTQANRSKGRDQLRRRRPVRDRRLRPMSRSICRGCGITVGGEQKWCGACRPAAWEGASVLGLAAARARRVVLQEQGQDPARSATARVKVGTANRTRRKEELAWDRDHPNHPDPAEFQRQVLPLIQGVPLRQLAVRTGLSVTYCGEIRRGLHTPHPRWWEALARAAQTS